MASVIWWLGQDLRLHDNQCLAGLGAGDRLLPVAVLDATSPMVQIDGQALGFARQHPRRQAFRLQGLLALQVALRAAGSDLLCVEGEPARQLAELASASQADTVRFSQAAGTEESQSHSAVRRRLAPLGLRCQASWQHTLVPPAQLPFGPGELPAVFTTFRTALEKHWRPQPPLAAPLRLPPLPALDADWWQSSAACLASQSEPPALDPRASLAFNGGEVAGLARLDDYVFGRRALAHYKQSRNGLVGADYSSKLSPWLAQGSLSARQVHAAVRDYERRFGSNASTTWLVFELLWRDFFEFSAARHGADLFRRGGIRQRPAQGRHHLADFRRWCEGRTGDPFVDAGMTELAATGYLGNRARQNVASYLVHDLGIDWRWGAAWFEHQLLDYAPASNYGNWQYIAGVGHDPRPLRRFDTVAQAQRYDRDAAYRARWLGPQWQVPAG